jgi:hypothetical protein
LADLVIAALVGVLVGAWLGVNWADRRRAIYEIRQYARKAWKGRSEYRRKRR